MKDLSIAFESSCDDTSLAVISQHKVLYEKTISEDSIIKSYGGVFPEIIARSHIWNFMYCFNELDKTIVNWRKRIKRISYTSEPGFTGSLVISKCIAETFSLNLFNTTEAININSISKLYDTKKIILVKVNHLDGHIYSPFILKEAKYPFLAAVLSGGHTHIYYVAAFNNKKLVSKTRDDAIGEAYDKIGRLFGIKYPWGKNIDLLVGHELNKLKAGSDWKSPLLKDGSFSFSGIKTKLAKIHSENINLSEARRKKYLEIFQKISQEAIYKRICELSKEYKVKNISVGGGVASNTFLRKLLNNDPILNPSFPALNHCTDNATMIANVTWHALQKCNLIQ